MRYIYLDNNATTPCDQAVIDVMLPFFGEEYGNPSSPHLMGKRASDACAQARKSVAELLQCRASEIIFTSGATESNNLAILGVMSHGSSGAKIVTSRIEHKSVGEPCRHLANQGIQVVEIGVNSDGLIDVEEAEKSIDKNTILVTIQAANNETGVLQPVQEIAEIAHFRGALFHCDASQWIGKLPITQEFGCCDYLSLSGHKLYGPKGIGVLMVRNGTPRRSIVSSFRGGEQENGIRPGTLNVPGIVGLGHACHLAQKTVKRDEIALRSMRNRLETVVGQALPGSWVNGSGVNRLPGSSSLTIPGVPASMLIASLHQICIGEGSACASGTLEPSHVLLAMGLSREHADCTVRISFGRQNTLADADEAALAICQEAIRIMDASSSSEAPTVDIAGGSER